MANPVENNTNSALSRRDKFSQRLKGKYADREFADDEALFSQIDDDYNEMESRISDYEKNENDILGMFASDPRSAAFLSSWRKGENPSTQFVRQFGREMVEALNDPEKAEEIAAANQEYLDRVAENTRMKEEYETNLQASLEEIDNFQQQNNLTDEQLDEVLQSVQQTVSDVLSGKFSVGLLTMFLRGKTYDNDLAAARADGEIAGRNATIDEKRQKRTKVSGMPTSLGGRGGNSPAPRKDIDTLRDVQSDGDYMKSLGVKRTQHRR